MIWGYVVVVFLLLTWVISDGVHAARNSVYPCPSTVSLQWVRDPQNCQKYYICNFGQPITMPNCPKNQVWSNGALNCVPKMSTWNDCAKGGLAQTVSTQRPDTSKSAQLVTVFATTKHRTTTREVTTTLKIPRESPCYGKKGQLLPHSKNCHWFYNCSLTPTQSATHEPFTVECKYPQLFDVELMRCREYLDMNCSSRFEPVDPCEYRENQCTKQNCVPCQERFSNCRGKKNGIYPFKENRWTPIFVTCYEQRNIAQDKCLEPTPFFSPYAYDCVPLFDVPKRVGGLQPECSVRTDGVYPDEQGRCGIYYECKNFIFRGYSQCPEKLVFNPLTTKCQSPKTSPPPCGSGKAPQCVERPDGYYPDIHGRCPYYFECRDGEFKQFLRCDLGSFDVDRQKCVVPTKQLPKPCGQKENPCQKRPDGRYPSQSSPCSDFLECKNNILIRKGKCPRDLVFSQTRGRCDLAENSSPCNEITTCRYTMDGLYPARTRGCSYYFECRAGGFLGYKRCSYGIGGILFNEETNKCDVPQNVCPPCGYKWFGCSPRRRTSA